ncbi:MAG: hypothetical protein L0170_00960 [Acidobacteria bacterium]|nr:hypothetical protein [Acidobacteriota bacterium]
MSTTRGALDLDPTLQGRRIARRRRQGLRVLKSIHGSGRGRKGDPRGLRARRVAEQDSHWGRHLSPPKREIGAAMVKQCFPIRFD